VHICFMFLSLEVKLRNTNLPVSVFPVFCKPLTQTTSQPAAPFSQPFLLAGLQPVRSAAPQRLSSATSAGIQCRDLGYFAASPPLREYQAQPRNPPGPQICREASPSIHAADRCSMGLPSYPWLQPTAIAAPERDLVDAATATCVRQPALGSPRRHGRSARALPALPSFSFSSSRRRAGCQLPKVLSRIAPGAAALAATRCLLNI
jgi:hypothetical protein